MTHVWHSHSCSTKLSTSRQWNSQSSHSQVSAGSSHTHHRILLVLSMGHLPCRVKIVLPVECYHTFSWNSCLYTWNSSIRIVPSILHSSATRDPVAQWYVRMSDYYSEGPEFKSQLGPVFSGLLQQVSVMNNHVGLPSLLSESQSCWHF